MDWAKRQSEKLRIDPGIMIQNLAHQTGKFSLANRACKAIEGNRCSKEIIKEQMLRSLDLSQLNTDEAAFLTRVTG